MKSKILPSKKYLLITSILLLFCIVVYGFLDFKLRTETNVEIEWSDSVIINGIPYYNIENKQIESDSLIGNKIGEVLFNVSENIHDPNYIFKNGDATFLEVGTPIYLVKNNENAVAVYVEGKYILYIPLLQ